MKKHRIFTLALAALILFATLPALAQNRVVGTLAPDFTVTTSDGESITLSESLKKYKAVVINFWYMQCGWCQYEFPFLEEYYQSVQDDVLVLALNPYDTNDAIRVYKSALKLSFPMASDADVMEYYNVGSFPTTVVIDSDGICQAYESGAKSSKEDFETMVSPYLGTPEKASATSLPDEGVYTIKFKDQNGSPVTGITAQLCDEASCNLLVPDNSGIIKYTGKIHDYELHLLGIPDGYSFDSDSVIPLSDGAIEYTVALTKLESEAPPAIPDNQVKSDSSTTALIIIIAAIIIAAVTLIIIIKKREAK